MYSDGIIGNFGLLEVIGGLTAGVYNYFRDKTSQAYKLKDTIPRAYDYIHPPISPEQEQETTQQTLKAFMAANAPEGMFK